MSDDINVNNVFHVQSAFIEAKHISFVDSVLFYKYAISIMINFIKLSWFKKENCVIIWRTSKIAGRYFSVFYGVYDPNFVNKTYGQSYRLMILNLIL